MRLAVPPLWLLATLACSTGEVHDDSGPLDDTGSGADAGSTGDAGGSDGGGVSTGSGYHPAGYADSSVHGLAAKMNEETCTDCHGSDLGSGTTGVSCDDCHSAGWRTSCTFCHGGVQDSTGGPPEDIDDSTVEAAFGAHPRHVETNNHEAFDCTECHKKPTDVLSSGHLWDSTPGKAEVDFSAGLSASASWSASAQSCSNLYCHGNGQGNNGSVSVGDGPLSCHSCHADASSGSSAWSAMSGEHKRHMDQGFPCAYCHGGTADADQNIVDPAQHVDGSVVFAADGGTLWLNSGTCTGYCHGQFHFFQGW